MPLDSFDDADEMSCDVWAVPDASVVVCDCKGDLDWIEVEELCELLCDLEWLETAVEWTNGERSDSALPYAGFAREQSKSLGVQLHPFQP